ncbi:MAG: hypothetical protein AMXMBFR84_23430 [Candidatus Hydrogenedentota bacterium]
MDIGALLQQIFAFVLGLLEALFGFVGDPFGQNEEEEAATE